MQKPRVSVITRREADYSRANRSEGFKLFKNTDPSMHPNTQSVEYVRALRAAKMKHMFAKPFIASLEGHSDSVYSLCRHPKDLRKVISGGADGDIRVWDLSSRQCVRTIHAHPQIVNDVSCSPVSDLILSVGSDGNVCGFSTNTNFAYAAKGSLNSIDHSWGDQVFVTSGSTLDLWSPHRNTPIQTFNFGTTTYTDAVFNQNEHNLICACATDSSVIIADTRTREVVHTMRLANVTNSVDWNPQTVSHFIAGCNDTACYLFDVRQPDSAVRVFQDHLQPVTSVSFSPNGREFVSGSYDGTIRIWSWEKAKSRDCYHTHRMQRVFSVCISPDSKFALCGSEDMNIRMFKTKANEELRVVSQKQKRSMDYQERLVKKWRYAPEVRAIADKQNLPQKLHNARRQRAIKQAAEQRKELARMAHAQNPDEVKSEPLRVKRVINQDNYDQV